MVSLIGVIVAEVLPALFAPPVYFIAVSCRCIFKITVVVSSAVVYSKEKFPAQATWSVDACSSLLLVDWKKYGKFAFDIPVEESNGIIWPYPLELF